MSLLRTLATFVIAHWRAWLPPLLMTLAILAIAAFFVSQQGDDSLLYRRF